MLRCVNDGVTTIKPGLQTTGNVRVTWSDDSFFTLFPAPGRVYVWRTLEKAYNSEYPFSTVKHGKFCDGLVYSLGPLITLHGRIAENDFMDRLGNQVHPMIQTLFPNNDSVFQDDNAPGTKLEQLIHGLRDSHQIRTSLNHSGQFWRLK
jgi:hypothetical protein